MTAFRSFPLASVSAIMNRRLDTRSRWENIKDLKDVSFGDVTSKFMHEDTVVGIIT